MHRVLLTACCAAALLVQRLCAGGGAVKPEDAEEAVAMLWELRELCPQEAPAHSLRALVACVDLLGQQRRGRGRPEALKLRVLAAANFMLMGSLNEVR